MAASKSDWAFGALETERAILTSQDSSPMVRATEPPAAEGS